MEKWIVDSVHYFDQVADMIVPPELKDHSWFIPRKWNQPCFDAVQLLPNNGFRFVQVTRSKTHSLKLKYIVEFLNCFEKVVSFEICCVLPNENEYKDFQLKPAEGSLGNYLPKLKKRKEKKLEFDFFVFGFERRRS
jgi:hypothetical protein